MLEGFEVYKGQASRVVSGAFVTIQKSGIFALSPDAWEALGKPEAVELLFNRQNRVMGFRGISPDASHSYRVRDVRSSPSRLVSGRGYLHTYNIATPKATRYPAVMVGDVLTVDLKAKPADAGKGRG